MAEPAPTADIPCMNLTLAATGVYRFKVHGYSIVTGMMASQQDHHYESDVFSIGGYDWTVRYHPGSRISSNHVEVCLVLLPPKGKAQGDGKVAVSFACTLLGKSGEPSVEMEKVSSTIVYFGDDDEEDAYVATDNSIRYEDLEKFVVGDSFVLQCSVSVLKWPKSFGDRGDARV